MSYETLLVGTHGPVTLVRLNRPQTLNALNTQVLVDKDPEKGVHSARRSIAYHAHAGMRQAYFIS